MADTNVTAQTIIDNSIVRQKDAQKVDWSDAELLIYLNKARDHIHQILVMQNEEIAANEGTITIVALTQEYDLSGNLDDFWKMAPNGVWFNGYTSILSPATVEDKIRYGSTTTDTAPDLYYLTSTKLGLIPKPTATSVITYNALKCRYYKKETDLSLSSYMPYKNIFNEAISVFIDSMAMMRLGVDSSEYTAIYNALEKTVFEILAKRSQL